MLVADSAPWINEPGLVSIIIPAYNCGKYITVMLDSIFQQTYQKFEIIIAYDEKSTDNTLDIINNYTSDNRLIVDTAIDSCLGAARKRGAQFAKGEYIIHIDADDMLTPSFLSDLLSIFRQYPHLQVVCGTALSSSESDVENKYNRCMSSSIDSCLYSQVDAIKHWVNWSPIDRHIWVWLIKREFIDENNIYHPLCTYGEDQIFTVQLLLNTDEIGYCGRCGYIYISHITSLIGRQKNPFERWEDNAVLRKELSHLLLEKYPEIDKTVRNQFAWVFTLARP